MKKQTWWDKNLDKRYDEFVSWVGPSSSTSKVWARTFVKKRGYKTLLDLGCGPATEFFAYQKEYPDLKYFGVDSSSFLFNRNSLNGIPMICAPIEETGLPDNYVEVSFSRHVLEHQSNFKECLNEIIRLASKVAIHIFFIPPGNDPEHIGYDSKEDLYHNRYNITDIETFLKNRKDVESFEWVKISTEEVALIINKKGAIS